MRIGGQDLGVWWLEGMWGIALLDLLGIFGFTLMCQELKQKTFNVFCQGTSKENGLQYALVIQGKSLVSVLLMLCCFIVTSKHVQGKK